MLDVQIPIICPSSAEKGVKGVQYNESPKTPKAKDSERGDRVPCCIAAGEFLAGYNLRWVAYQATASMQHGIDSPRLVSLTKIKNRNNQNIIYKIIKSKI